MNLIPFPSKSARPPVENRRAIMVSRMSADLVANDAFGCEDDAIMLLAHKGYRIVDIFMLVPDAMQAAFQQTIDLVAQEISAS